MDVKEAIETRRSIRKFSPKELHPEEIIDIVDAGRYAPSAGNQQNWKFILIKDQSKKNDLADACFQQNWMASAPLIICVVGMTDDVKRMYGTRGEMLYSIQNCAMAAQNIMLRAHEMGFGSCMVSAFEEGMVKAFFALITLRTFISSSDATTCRQFFLKAVRAITPQPVPRSNTSLPSKLAGKFSNTNDVDHVIFGDGLNTPVGINRSILPIDTSS